MSPGRRHCTLIHNPKNKGEDRITGEQPYAEWHGDLTSLDFSPLTADMTALANYRSQGKKIVTVFVTGRPRIVPQLIEASDAFMVAWLPGTEGGGVADILFGEHQFTGQLPFTWPGSGGTIQFPYGAGITTDNHPTSIAARDRETAPAAREEVTVIRPIAITLNKFTAGPNPAARSAGTINFFWQGKAIENSTLHIYDASGNAIRKIEISDNSIGTTGRRQVGSWNFTNSKGILASEGSYVVRGSITGKDGKKEKVSIIIGVR